MAESTGSGDSGKRSFADKFKHPMPDLREKLKGRLSRLLLNVPSQSFVGGKRDAPANAIDSASSRM